MRIVRSKAVEGAITPLSIVTGRAQLTLPDAPSTSFKVKRPSLAGICGWHKVAIAAVLVGAFFGAPGAALRSAHAQGIEQPPTAAVELDENERTLKEKITLLVNTDHERDLARAFHHYDSIVRDGALDPDELHALFTDAGIGNRLTRLAWVPKVIKRFDEGPGAIQNGKVDWHELQSVLLP